MDTQPDYTREEAVVLLPCQAAAIASIRQQATALEPGAMDTIRQIFHMSNIDISRLDEVKANIRDHAHIALHFHPDRPAGDGTVASALLRDGIYRNQFETGISNGLIAAFRGSPRDIWENSLFNDAYADTDVGLACRPKYGALDLTKYMDGPAPRFGSCYFLLKPTVSTRATYTFGGSQATPKYLGTIENLDAILAAILEESFTRDFMLGISGVRPTQIIELLCDLSEPATPDVASPSRNLDHMIEAQIHGDIRLARDVDTLVIDQAFQKNEVGRQLEQIGRKYGFPVRYHRGFELDVESIPSDFRGPSMPSLGRRISTNGVVNTAMIGLAAQDLSKNPQKWADRGTYSEVLQELKLMWHVLVRHGV